jgi:hypothetical protein
VDFSELTFDGQRASGGEVQEKGAVGTSGGGFLTGVAMGQRRTGTGMMAPGAATPQGRTVRGSVPLRAGW